MKRLALSLFMVPLIAMEPDTRVSIPQEKQDEDKLCELILNAYKRRNSDPDFAPFMRKVIRKVYNEPENAHKRTIIDKIKDGSSSEKDLQDLIIEASTEAVKRLQIKKNKRWKQRKAACCATATGIITTALTTATALVAHFTTQKECPK